MEDRSIKNIGVSCVCMCTLVFIRESSIPRFHPSPQSRLPMTFHCLELYMWSSTNCWQRGMSFPWLASKIGLSLSKAERNPHIICTNSCLNNNNNNCYWSSTLVGSIISTACVLTHLIVVNSVMSWLLFPQFSR